MFPGELSGTDKARVWYDFGFLALISSGLVYASRSRLRQAARHGLIWIGVAVVLVLGYTFRDDLLGVVLRVRSELIPGFAVETAPRSLVVSQSDDGNFYVMGKVNGAPVRFLLDTGASDIVLSPGDAQRLGIDLTALDFDRAYETANGVGHGAAFTLDHLAVGPIALTQVPVSINQAPIGSSLLGMTFFRHLDAFEIRGRRLFLRWRGPTLDPGRARVP